jgi:hypothetical protein
MKVSPNTVTQRRVYGYFQNNTIKYIGSSYCKLETLENNHRNWKEKYGEQGRTYFRENIKKGEFKTLLELNMDQKSIEDLEGQLIRALRPMYNKDLNPVNSSIKYQRYNAI